MSGESSIPSIAQYSHSQSLVQEPGSRKEYGQRKETSFIPVCGDGLEEGTRALLKLKLRIKPITNILSFLPPNKPRDITMVS